jgi:hypothetical protein
MRFWERFYTRVIFPDGIIRDGIFHSLSFRLLAASIGAVHSTTPTQR